jgi:hypothetical protein
MNGFLSSFNICRALLALVILATWEVEIGKIAVKGQQIVLKTSPPKKTKNYYFCYFLFTHLRIDFSDT